MSTPLAGIRSREVGELPDGVQKNFRFSGVTVMELASGNPVFVTGPVDLHKYGDLMFTFISPRTGQSQTRPGVTLHVSEEDGKAVNKPLNIISKRLLEQLIPDLASGVYLTTLYAITASGPPPNTTYEVVRKGIPL